MHDARLTRRESLGLAALAAGAVAAPAAAKSARRPRIDFITKIDFKDPKWNRDTYARIDADIDPTREKCGWLKGKAYGVRDNEKVRALFGVEGFSFTRCKRLEDGSFRRMLREIVFYRDLESGKIMDSWHNPYTNEHVKVVPIANDPFNFTISEFRPDPPSYGGLQTAKPPRTPFIQEWEFGPDGTMVLHTGIDMIYPNALQPDKWVRESSGPMNRVSEHFIYVVKRADVENPRLTHIPHVGSWSRVTPWLPWMLMGQAPGHVNYFTHFQTIDNGIAGLPADLVAAARAMDEKWLHSPTEDYGPSLSSLENYAREQKPAPVPPGWTRTARLLHWGMALAIAVEVPVGFIMAWTYAAKDAGGKLDHIRASQVHHTIGLLLLAAVLFRLVWRWRHPAPQLPVSTPRWQAMLARATQALLYGLLLVIPLSGWAALSSMAAGGGYPAPSIWFFTHDGNGPGGLIPHIVTPVAWNAPTLFNFGFFARAHVYLLMLGGALLVLHGSAALLHHFVRRDDVLRAMWRGNK